MPDCWNSLTISAATAPSFLSSENFPRAQPAGLGDALRARLELARALEEPPEPAHVVLHARALELRDVALIEQVQTLDVLQRQGLERGGRGDDERPSRASPSAARTAARG